jgi:hypothetical protein
VITARNENSLNYLNSSLSGVILAFSCTAHNVPHTHTHTHTQACRMLRDVVRDVVAEKLLVPTSEFESAALGMGGEAALLKLFEKELQVLVVREGDGAQGGEGGEAAGGEGGGEGVRGEDVVLMVSGLVAKGKASLSFWSLLTRRSLLTLTRLF